MERAGCSITVTRTCLNVETYELCSYTLLLLCISISEGSHNSTRIVFYQHSDRIFTSNASVNSLYAGSGSFIVWVIKEQLAETYMHGFLQRCHEDDIVTCLSYTICVKMHCQAVISDLINV